ncbi:MAG: RNA polymerase sigma factor [Gammaproteobacteria bacterium]
MADDDLQLLEGIKNQQQASLEAFYRKYENSVYRFALSKLNNSFDASDIVNEVMMEVWKNAHRFEGRSKVSTWLLGIAHHKIIDLFRKRKKNEVDIDEANDIADDSFNMEQVLQGIENSKFIQKCLERLKGDHKQAVHLLFFKDYSYDEIAEVIECPVGTVKSRIHHAKVSLKKCLQKFIQAGS